MDGYRKIIRNKAKCLLCNDEIESKHGHDYVKCNCGRLAVDGGTRYLARTYNLEEDWLDTSIVERTEDE